MKEESYAYEKVEFKSNVFDENENQFSLVEESVCGCGPSTLNVDEEDAEDPPPEAQSEGISEDDVDEELPQVQSSLEFLMPQPATSQIIEIEEESSEDGGEDSEDEETAEPGEKIFQDIAEQNCRKEIFSTEVQDGEESENEEDGGLVLPESCFRRSGLSKLSFCSNYSEPEVEPEVETPKFKRQATVCQDGIIEPASDSDSDTDEEEEEEEADVNQNGGAEELTEEVCRGIKFPRFYPGQKLRCDAVELRSPLELWVREEGRTQEFYETSNSLQTIYSLLDQETRASWSAGSSCAVKTRDKGWVRGLVLAVEGEDVRLLLGDIGRVVTMAREDLQPLQVEFTREAFFCFCVKVPGIVPAGSTSRVTAPWSKKAQAVIEEHGHQPLLVEVNMFPVCFNSTSNVFMSDRKTR